MESSSIFWNKTAEWLEGHGLPYISEFEAILILLAAFLVLLLIFWLVVRKARLWYWKTNIQIDTLKSIDVRLNNVENKLTEAVSLKAVQENESETPAPEEESQAPETGKEKALFEEEGLIAIGKSGIIYKEAELELQIRE